VFSDFLPVHILQPVVVGGPRSEPLVCVDGDLPLPILDDIPSELLVPFPEEVVRGLVVADPQHEVPGRSVGVAVVGGGVVHACHYTLHRTIRKRTLHHFADYSEKTVSPLLPVLYARLIVLGRF
jgi:hypothetical protein